MLSRELLELIGGMSPLAITIGEGALGFHAPKKVVCARGHGPHRHRCTLPQLSEEICFSCLQSSLAVDPTKSA